METWNEKVKKVEAWNQEVEYYLAKEKAKRDKKEQDERTEKGDV